ncbi:DUF6498-containing protein [Halopiger xanaduensis]|uniref:Uncharacterized protein n=1 Tax=Halopiger xanaduensis (strain DSM 18323 / JCM 14033 / SH-6) TaxID=797210 RepID=F8D5W5_HALXS|nr:DUF6498-containing protein [Halopiger xanaduensis]AEH37691.1 hypothetical protein Halxa_3077 [Halopiger xanaduensis SH-6]
MEGPGNPQRRRRIELAGAVWANVLPLIGVLVWEWDLAALILLYWLEVGVGLWWAAIEAGIAERPSDYSPAMLIFGTARYRRGGVSIPRTSLTWYVHNLPIVALTAIFFGCAWALVGVIGLESVLAAQGTGRSVGGTLGSVLGFAGCLFVGRGWETLSVYVGERRYRDANAQQVVQEALWPLWILGLIVMAVLPVVQEAATGSPLLVALIGGKFLFDLLRSTYGSIRAFDADNGGWLGAADIGDDSDWEPRPLESSPTSDASTRIRPHRIGVVLEGISAGFSSVLGALFALLAAFVIAVLLLGGDRSVLWWLPVPLALVAGLGVLDRALRYWAITYRIDDRGNLLASGRLSGRTHRVVDGDGVSTVDVVVTRTDRRLETTTVRIDPVDAERTVRIPCLADRDARAVLECLGDADRHEPEADALARASN